MYENFHFLYFSFILCAVLFQCANLSSRLSPGILDMTKEFKFDVKIPMFVFIVVLSLIIGGRPGTTNFGDTALYQKIYELGNFSYKAEPAFNLLGTICHSFNLSTVLYLSVICFIYVILPYLFISKFTHYQWLAILFVLGSFSFLGYGVNGIRNGIALSYVIMLFCFINEIGKPRWFICAPLMLLAIFTHKSSILPIICFVISCYYIKNIKTALYIWFSAVPISLVAGSVISSLFLGMGFDDRLDDYLSVASVRGFRWDFILYSILPIILAMYIEKKNVSVDRLYSILINTYILSNALWVLVIRASFSNRFAYLSWFLYPIVIAYPILKFKIWENQNSKIALILFLYYSFTYGMFLMGRL